MAELKHIFLVDDDDTFVFLTQETIHDTNIPVKVSVFDEGQKVLDELKNNRDKPALLPDILFLDLHLYVMNGWQFLDEFTAMSSTLSKEIKLFILSSSISPYDVERAKLYPVVMDFIVKPIKPSKFEQIINSI